jgi:hypothetical protein
VRARRELSLSADARVMLVFAPVVALVIAALTLATQLLTRTRHRVE